MADLDANIEALAGDERPIAVRRKRRCSSGTGPRSQSNSQAAPPRPHGISTPPATPQRSKKRVRFSDPGPTIESDYAASGLTPFLRKASLSSPSSKRRRSTPAACPSHAIDDSPICGTLQFEPLRQILDGRVKRRLRRNRLSEEINNIESDKKHEAKARRLEVDRLRAELAAKDVEMQSMRDEQEIASQLEEESGATLPENMNLSTKVQELEQQIRDLKAELERSESEVDPDWTLAAQDPFNFENDNDNDDATITNYDHDFSMIDDEVLTTPTRLNTSFPSPPSTMPNTPCKASSVMSAGAQTSFTLPDPEKDALQTELESLHLEVSRLTAAIAFNDDNQTRLADKLADFLPSDESHDSSSVDTALDTVLTQLALSQVQALEHGSAFSALGSEITKLGFSSCSGPEEILERIAVQFRQARLDLEYLTPGEVVEGFENDKLLEMLVARIRVLLQKTKDQDSSIDQYHEQEVSLRQQLGSQVDALKDVQKELSLANSIVGDLREEIDEERISNDRLKAALESYRAEVKSLQKLIERMEKDGAQNEAALRSQVKEVDERLQNEILSHDTTQADCEGKDILIVELERRLNASLQAAAEVQEQMTALAASHEHILADNSAKTQRLKSSALQRERDHGEALALRDARVSELRDEIQRVNEALKAAHSTILTLRTENRSLEGMVEGEKTRGQLVVQAMREQLNQVQETGLDYINNEVSNHTTRREGSCPADMGASAVATPSAVLRPGKYLEGKLARRSSKKRRRYDSGLGFLEEAEEDSEMTLAI